LTKRKQSDFDRIHFSHKTIKWNTPSQVYKRLDYEFHFSFDPCIPSFSGFTGNGLKEPWKGNVFCNYPYDEALKWVQKGWRELCKGNAKLIVFLMPFKVNKAMLFLKKRGAEFRIAERRLHFNNDKNPAPFDSMIAILTKKNVMEYWKKLGIA